MSALPAIPMALLLLAQVAPPELRPTLSTPKLRGGVPVAKLSFVEGVLEHSEVRGGWKRGQEGFQVKTGDRLRTGASTLARFAFPWQTVTAGPATSLRVPVDAVLSVVLEEGRLELAGEGSVDIVKTLTANAEVRGKGRVVLRHRDRTTSVTVLDGRFRVAGAGTFVSLERGQAAIVAADSGPERVDPLPSPPVGLTPGADPRYVRLGQALKLEWKAEPEARFHLQVLSVDADVAVLERDVEGGAFEIQVPWPGTYRWRVASRDARGIEGLPSSDGIFCMVDR